MRLAARGCGVGHLQVIWRGDRHSREELERIPILDNEPKAYEVNAVVRLPPASAGTSHTRAGPGDEVVGPLADHSHDRLKSGGHHISQCMFPCTSGRQALLVLAKRSLGWRHLVRLG